MNAEQNAQAHKLRILHVFRAPLGGLFRHVIDLANEQVARGHDVGLFFDSQSKGDHVAAALARISGGLSLGASGCPIRRNPHPSDAIAIARFMKKIDEVKPHIVHGHGSKGGLYARSPGLLQPAAGPVRAYTPHGGSFNYQPGSLMHRAYMATEKLMTLSTDVFLFESAYIAGRFDAFVGSKTGIRRIVANGISCAEFVPVAPDSDAADFLYVGELRAAKGIDTLLDAIALAGSKLGAIPRAVLVGSGPDKEVLLAHAQRLGIAHRLSFPGPMAVREAFKLGRIMVVPSRAESLPYVVLEAAAARVPLVSTDVGGIPEIFGPYRDRLGPSDNAADLCARMLATMRLPKVELERQLAELAAYVEKHFSIRTMVDSVMEGYGEAMARRAPDRPRARLSNMPSNA
ncbi:glycosyltransferase family 4 protein [Methylocapsa sp. S129]|uniref:glycosyltransferase family 4 protein n=1 Tax=Methylocapsa sp. S129 TaxID=1641869 RepID=UPI00131C1333|nr:glycosyltransferase family 4 protein [Methylocapsa sp. S129]